MVFWLWVVIAILSFFPVAWGLGLAGAYLYLRWTKRWVGVVDKLDDRFRRWWGRWL